MTIMSYLFCLAFRNRSLFLDMQSGKAPAFRKDTIYHLKNAAHILISEAQSAGIHVDYVLFDSWFSSPKVIRSMREKNLDVVAMVKKSSKSVLHLTGECRSLSYDAMCAQCAIVFARYMFLAVGV